jgi:hypothetical protein
MIHWIFNGIFVNDFRISYGLLKCDIFNIKQIETLFLRNEIFHRQYVLLTYVLFKQCKTYFFTIYLLEICDTTCHTYIIRHDRITIQRVKLKEVLPLVLKFIYQFTKKNISDNKKTHFTCFLLVMEHMPFTCR